MRKYLFIILLVGVCFGQLFELTHNNATRHYWVDYPENATEATPLVINMHGLNQWLVTYVPETQMSSFANPQNIAVVYPQGVDFWGNPAWNAGVWWSNSIFDDVGYINALIDSVISNFAIDTNRIYACGFSNGGFMAYDLACELPDRIVAFGSVSGNFMMNSNQDCTNEREIPIIHIHGTSDPIVNYYPPTIDFSMASLQAMDWWSVENNLTEQSVVELNESVNIYTNYSLNSNTKFVHFQVVGGGHEWFNYNWGFHASEELLNFFMQYSMIDFVDHSPVLASIENQQTYEDTPFSVDISATSPIGSQITYNAYSDTSAVSTSMEAQTLNVTPEQNWHGTSTITVYVTDENNVSDTTSFLLTVLSVNDPPTIEQVDDILISEDSTAVVFLNAVDIDTDDLMYNFYPTQPVFNFNHSGDSLYITPFMNWNGQVNLSIFVSDGDNSDNISLNITVVSVNDPPEEFGLISPTVLDTFQISTTTDETIPFTWEPSFDVDSDVTYKLTVTLDYFGNVFTNEYEDIIDTTTAIAGYEYAILMTNLNLPRWNMDYVIEASDEEFAIVSDEGQFVFENTSLSIYGEIIPEVFALHQNYPNPFNPITSLRYDLPEDGLVNITIYDMMGRIVKTLINGSQTAGYKSIRWNATNDRNEPVSAGLYLYTIQIGEFRQTKKMVLLK